MDPIERHPEYIKAKEHLIEKGLKYERLTYTVDTTNTYAQFVPPGEEV